MRYLKRISVFASGALFLSGAHVYATPLGEAQKESADAKNLYWEKVYANPTISRDERVKLYNTIVAPTQTKLGDALNQTVQDAREKIFGPSRRLIEKRALQKSAAPTVAGTGVPGSFGNPVSSSLKSVQPPPYNGPYRPEVVLDGSGIPKEMEFKSKLTHVKMGSPSLSPPPAESPNPAPSDSPSPAAKPSEAGGVDELDFPVRPRNSPSPIGVD